MNCPLCVDRMLQPRRQAGIEIDVCPHCHGVWLDRGEIEKLVGRAEPRPRPVEPMRESSPGRGEVWTEPKKKKKKKRQKSLGERLGDILEDALDL